MIIKDNQSCIAQYDCLYLCMAPMVNTYVYMNDHLM